jgi:hypothetical protein
LSQLINGGDLGGRNIINNSHRPNERGGEANASQVHVGAKEREKIEEICVTRERSERKKLIKKQ